MFLRVSAQQEHFTIGSVDCWLKNLRSKIFLVFRWCKTDLGKYFDSNCLFFLSAKGLSEGFANIACPTPQNCLPSWVMRIGSKQMHQIWLEKQCLGHSNSMLSRDAIMCRLNLLDLCCAPRAELSTRVFPFYKKRLSAMVRWLVFHWYFEFPRFIDTFDVFSLRVLCCSGRSFCLHPWLSVRFPLIEKQLLIWA